MTQHPDVIRTLKAMAQFRNCDTSSPAYRFGKHLVVLARIEFERAEIEYLSWFA